MDRQEFLDAFYWRHGPCCAGCDWWRSLNSLAGECTRSVPVSDRERWAMTGMTNASVEPASGYIVTMRDHHCGEFKDAFDWQSLPVAYLARIGFPTPHPRATVASLNGEPPCPSKNAS